MLFNVGDSFLVNSESGTKATLVNKITNNLYYVVWCNRPDDPYPTSTNLINAWITAGVWIPLPKQEVTNDH